MKRRKSDADQKRAVNAALDFLGVPIRNDVKPKRAYTKRSEGSEHQEQSAVVDWWDVACKGYGLPHFALFAVPNGAFFGSGYATAAKLKKEGMRKGILDLVLAVPRDQFHGLFIEMKYGSNTPTPEQWKVKEYLEKAGYCCSIHWSADEAIKAIKEYLQ
jgi:hypothetical protein